LCDYYHQTKNGDMRYRGVAAIMGAARVKIFIRGFQVEHSVNREFKCRKCEKVRPWFEEMKSVSCKKLECPELSFCMECAVLRDVEFKVTNPGRNYQGRYMHLPFKCTVCGATAAPIRVDHWRLLASDKFAFSTKDVIRVIDRLLHEWGEKTGETNDGINRWLRVLSLQVRGRDVPAIPRSTNHPP
jgi:hypothetical protein